MKTLAESRPLRFTTFGALYFAQGVPWGFIAVGYLVFLTDLGLDNTEVGTALGIAYVPWSFKLVWGPLFDRFPTKRFGRRRPYVIFAELGMGLSLISLLTVDPARELATVSVILFVHNTFASMQDVAVDGLAVDILPEDERGRANAVMWAAKSAGIAVGGGAGTAFAKYVGWPALFVAIAIVIWAIMVLVVFVRERPRDDEGEAHTAIERFSFRELKRSFAFAAPLWGLLFAMAAVAGAGLKGAVFTRTIRADLGFGEEAIATLNGIIEPLCGVAGALLGGFLADRIGFRRTMALFLLTGGAWISVFAIGHAPDAGFLFVGVWFGVYALLFNAYSAASLGFYMTLSNPAIGATQFTVFMAASNLTYAWSTPAGGYIADTWGVPATFVVASVVMVASAAILPACDPSTAEERFRGTVRA